MNKQYAKLGRYYLLYDKDGDLIGYGKFHDNMNVKYFASMGIDLLEYEEVENVIEIPERYDERWNKDG